MIYITIIVGLIVFGLSVVAFKRGWWTLLHRRVVGWTVILYGIYLSMLTGTYTEFVVPGFGGIVIGAGAGAAVGFATWLVVGTVGVATGGAGVAVGAGVMAFSGAILGGAGSAASGFGFKTVSYPLVSPLFWVTTIVIGIYFLYGRKIKMQKLLPPPVNSNRK